jgi:regulator of sirC expression with transglutaminase-like and TPR domain
MDATARFAALVARPPGDVPLDEAALVLAQHARPQLDVERALGALDDLASRSHATGFAEVREHLFVVEGFRGAVEHYADPANSFLDRVLERRVGIPITLSVLMVAVGARVGVGVVPVGMPGHFLVRDADRADVFCDPFHGGRELDVDGCRELFDRVHGGRRRFELSMLAPVSSHAVLARMLANLEHGPLARDRASLAWMVDLHLVLPGLGAGDRLALATHLRALGRFVEAAEQLEVVAAAMSAAARPPVDSEARALRARLN